LEFSGPCNIDYKTDDEGNIIVFEVNPRMGGSIMRPEKIADLCETLSTIIDAAISMPPES
jgi:carbamoylphosphate synthase large subunit